MLRCWLGEVEECCGRGMWRTDRGVGMGSVETDMPLSEAAGRDWEGDSAPFASWLCEAARLSFCFDPAPFFATVCRMVS